MIVPEDYPNDNDTNAIAFTVVKPTEARAKRFIDEILACKRSDGVVQVSHCSEFVPGTALKGSKVHLDPDRPRAAPEVSANILALFYVYGRGHQVQESLKYLENALVQEEYQESRYYFLPEPLFFYTWRLLCMASGSSELVTVDNKRLSPELHTLRDHLIRRVTARIGTEKDNALCPATRLLICQSLGIANTVDLRLLLDLQQYDGSFGQAWYVRYGSAKIKISHRALACVTAVVALRRLRQDQMGAEVALLNGETKKAVL